MSAIDAIGRKWRDAVRVSLAFALPHGCLLCASARSDALVCAECAAALPRNHTACEVCSLPLTTGRRCGRCLARPPPFERTHAPFLYAFPVDRLVQALKYQGTLACAAWFADAIVDALQGAPPSADLMVPMPLSAQRQRERGFNQSLEIARALSCRTGIPLASGIARRVRDTRPQADLPWDERGRNVRDAFACVGCVAGQRVVVVDDVMTTGASLDELARTLRRAGAIAVENWIVARTPAPGSAN